MNYPNEIYQCDAGGFELIIIQHGPRNIRLYAWGHGLLAKFERATAALLYIRAEFQMPGDTLDRTYD